MASVSHPPSLADLLNSAQTDRIRCIGVAYPSNQKCSQKLSTSSQHFAAARKCLQNILRRGMEVQGPGLIDALKAIASAFLCQETHRDANLELFPQYWLALNSLRSILNHTGLVKLPLCVSTDGKKARAAINGLNPTDVYWAHLALKKFHNHWWEVDEDGRLARLRDMLKERFESDERDVSKQNERQLALHRWISWGLPTGSMANSNDDGSNNNTPPLAQESIIAKSSLRASPVTTASSSAPTTPKKPPISRVSASAPQPSVSSDSGLSRESRFSPSPCAPQPRRSSRNHQMRASPFKFEMSSKVDKECDHDGPSIASDSRKDESSQISESMTANGSQSALVCREQPALNYFPNTAPPSLPVAQSHQSHKERSSAESGIDHESEIDASEDADHQATTSVSRVPHDLSYLDKMGCEGARVPSFKRCPKEPEDVRQTVFKVFAEMKKDLTDKSEDQGCIYALSIPGHEGYIKIGQTSREIEERIAEHKRCFGIRLNLLDYNDYCKVAHYKRVERLVHLELEQFRRCFDCACKSERQDHCDGADGLVEHGEWFEIDERKAKQVIRRWRNWMSGNPYCNRQLRQAEHLRISQYAKVTNKVTDGDDEVDGDQSQGTRAAVYEDLIPLNRLVDKDKHGNQIWRWDKFMQFSRWQLFCLQANVFFFEDRYERSDIRSRYDSLWTHWKSNALFYVTFFVLSRVVVSVAAVFPWLSTFAPPLALANTTLLGSIAVLYAA